MYDNVQVINQLIVYECVVSLPLSLSLSRLTRTGGTLQSLIASPQDRTSSFTIPCDGMTPHQYGVETDQDPQP